MSAESSPLPYTPRATDKLLTAGFLTWLRVAKRQDALLPGGLLNTAGAHHDLYQTGRTLTEYCLAHEISDVIFLDRRARAAHVAMGEYWRHAAPGQPLPTRHFLSIEPLKTLPRDATAPSQNISDLLKDFHATRPQLHAARERPTLLFDNCTHTGITIALAQTLLRVSGFEELHTGVLAYRSDKGHLPAEVDFAVAINQRWLPRCNTFGFGEEVVVEPDSFTASRGDCGALIGGRALRQSIRAIMRDQIAKNEGGSAG